MPRQLDEYLEVAVAAARRAQQVICENFEGDFSHREKAHQDPVTEVDLRCEAVIQETISERYPEHAFWGEECGRQDSPAPIMWVVDPLDGTRNFLHGLPHVATSIGVVVEGKRRVGVVLDAIRDEVFTAVAGQGAHLNGKRVEASRVERLHDALLATGFSNSPPFHGPLMLRLQELTQGVRRTGSAALDLCYVGAGRLDGFWDWSLGPWDMAAGSLFIEEAQGMVTRPDGSPFDFTRREILASNVHLHRALRQVIDEQRR